MLARRFLWIITGIIVLLLIGALAYRLFATELMRTALIPSVAYEEPVEATPSYAGPNLWIARPDIPDNPSFWLPKDMAEANDGGVDANASSVEANAAVPEADAANAEPRDTARKALVFFVHPTSYLERTRWNADLADAESQERARLFVRSQASAFNAIGDVWAPKYRQATFGAFLTTKEDAEKALSLAYRDVLAAFDQFVKDAPKDRPIILAGHSQGSLHLTRLLIDRVAGKPIADRIAAAYVVGWPISKTADLGRLGLPACETADQPSCIISFQTFAEPADPGIITDVYDATLGFDGTSRAGSPMVCVNPLTGNADDEAPASANLGATIPNDDLTEAHLARNAAPARCDVRGFLLIGEDPPKMGPYILPGNNYHVYDYALFWMNIRKDAETRLDAFLNR